MSETFADLFWRQFWQITCLIPVAVVLVRYVLRQAPHFCYGLLLIVLVKLVFPPIWTSPTGVLWGSSQPSRDAHRSEEVALQRSDQLEQSISEPVFAGRIAVSPQQEKLNPQGESATLTPRAAEFWAQWIPDSRDLQRILGALWAAGALCFLGFVIGKREQLIRFHYDMRAPASDQLLELVEQVSAELGLVRIPRVVVSQHPTVPFAAGAWRRVVVLPAHLVQETPESELKLILAHEFTHLRRGDTLASWLQLIVQVVWWFHPLVFWLNYEIRRVREECCDRDVVLQLKCSPVTYARCLLNMLELHHRLRPSTELIGLSPFEVTAKRLQNIMRSPTQPWHGWKAWGQCGCLMGVAACILPGSAASSTTPKVIVGQLVPQGAQTVVSTAVPEPPPAGNSAENGNTDPGLPGKSHSKPAPQPEPEDAQQVGIALPVEYGFSRGDDYAFRMRIEARHPSETRIHQGQFRVRVDAVAAGRAAFSLHDNTFSQRRIPRPDVSIPTLPEWDAPASDPFPFRGPRFGPTFSPFEETAPTERISGTNAHLNPATGRLPYLLGELPDWIFPELPQRLGKNESTELRQSVTLHDPHALPAGPFSSRGTEDLDVTVTRTATLSVTSEQRIELSQNWLLVSTESIHGEPLREIEMDGTLQLDHEGLLPESARYTGLLTEREPNREVRIPLVIELDALPLVGQDEPSRD